ASKCYQLRSPRWSGSYTERDDQAVIAHMDAIEQQDGQPEIVERPTAPGVQLLLRPRDNAPAHCAFARTAALDRRLKRLQAAPIQPRNDADQHLLDNAAIERVSLSHRL